MAFLESGSAAVLTGAGSGIGAELAVQLAARGVALALIDRDAGSLQTTAAAAQAHHTAVTTHLLDIADQAAILALPAAVLAAHGKVDVLINNAGVALIGGFEQASLADFAWLMDINFWGAVRLTHAFLPALRARPAAQIVLLSSVFGLIGPPGQTAYAASKFAIRGFGEALRHELAGSGIGVTLVHPGGIDTDIARNARIGAQMDPTTARADATAFQKMLRTSPATAAAAIIRAVERQQGRVLIGRDAYLIDIIQRLLPVSYWRIMKRMMAKRASGSWSRKAPDPS